MTFYRTTAEKMGYQRNSIFLVENGQELFFDRGQAKFGKKMDIKNVFLDQVSGEEVEHFVVRDRERLGKEGVIIVMAEIQSSDGQLADKPDIVARGTSIGDGRDLSLILMKELERMLTSHKGKVTNSIHLRKVIGKGIEQYLYKNFRIQPLVLPVIIEV
jgi:ribonuclease J